MKKLVLFALVAATSLYAAPAAQASPSCIGGGITSCNWIINGSFTDSTDQSATGWSSSPDTRFVNHADCTAPWVTTKVALLRPADASPGWVSQRIYPYLASTSGSVQFTLYLDNDTNNLYDQLSVIVTNLDTGAGQMWTFYGHQFNGCGRFSYNLTNVGGYINHNVELKFRASVLGTGTWLVDNAAFWTRCCP